MAGQASRINGKKGGRPRGSETSETKVRRSMKQRWLERVEGIADQLFDAHESLALGVYKEVQTPDGTVRVYKQGPDRHALEWMLDQVMGKAPQHINLDTEVDNKDTPLSPEDAALLQRSLNFAMAGFECEHCQNIKAGFVVETEDGETKPAHSVV